MVVIVVLSLFAIAGPVACVFGLVLTRVLSAERKQMRELADSGVETQAELVSLVPTSTPGSVNTLYEFRTGDGERATHSRYEIAGPGFVLGDPYPLVHHPSDTKLVVMGTMANVRKELRSRARTVRRMRIFSLCSFLAGALAFTGIQFLP
ncbi:DUF3592 domain-containing protein [Streptomyces sp. NPDC012637]|uniref:DUF3592 domain-containing protein n=1 Tax=Streptomyces sp. NPDC012637 TaxID=3364842 RepID=UPI0036F0F30E